MNIALDTTGQPNEEMASILARLAREDAMMPDPTTLPPVEGREVALLSNKRWNRDLPALQHVREFTFDGPTEFEISTKLFIPDGVEVGLILHIHGGGFAFCDIDTHERFIRLLALETRRSVLSIDYRLAPENPFPAGLDDCVAVFRQLDRLHVAHPETQGPTAITGDSAGANLALALILHEQAMNRPAPDFAMLYYGVYGTDFNTRSYLEFKSGPGLTREKMMRYLDWYALLDQRKNPLVAPLFASDEALSALPPLYLNAAEIDPLCSDTQCLAARLHRLGRQDELRIFPGVVHGFMQMTLCLPAACRATTEAAAAFRRFAGQS